MEDKLIKILSLLASFALVVCSLYLFGYWSSFGINILEFVTLSDVIKLGIYPLVVGVVGGAASLIIGFLGGTILPTPSYDGAEGAAITRMHKIIKIIIILMLVGFAVFLYLQNNPYFWYITGAVITLTLILTIADVKMFEPLIPNPSIRSFILAVGMGILPLSYGIGKTNAQSVLNGKSAKVVSTQTFKESETFKSKGQDALKFVGVAGDYFFFITMDNSVIYAVKYSDLHFLELKTQ
jgi:hypothetical protein